MVELWVAGGSAALRDGVWALPHHLRTAVRSWAACVRPWSDVR